jgi:hypothetical protein
MQSHILNSIKDTYSQVFNKEGSSVSKTVDILQMEKPKNSQGVFQQEAR